MNLLNRPSKLRTLLILGRVSNLPTVWSDCLAGWWLAGGRNWPALLCISISASFLYEAGMFLNDAFDADFDRQYRRNRPIPSGAIGRTEVWCWGYVWLVLGLAVLAWMGTTTVVLGLVLSACIVLYDAIHKIVPLSPLLMGACRLLVYLLAASAAPLGVSGEVVWKGLALGAYVVGLSCLARKESSGGGVNYWPIWLMAAPLLMAALVDDGPAWPAGGLFSAVLAAWVLWALSRSHGQIGSNVGYTVSQLLAGIVLVDLLAVASLSDGWPGLFGVWFPAALLLQRFVPAT